MTESIAEKRRLALAAAAAEIDRAQKIKRLGQSYLMPGVDPDAPEMPAGPRVHLPTPEEVRIGELPEPVQRALKQPPRDESGQYRFPQKGFGDGQPDDLEIKPHEYDRKRNPETDPYSGMWVSPPDPQDPRTTHELDPANVQRISDTPERNQHSSRPLRQEIKGHVYLDGRVVGKMSI